MKLKLKYFDPSDITTFVNKGTGKHIISDGFTTIPVYKGKQYSIKDVVNSDGTVNIRKAKKIMEEVAEYFGGKKMQNRPENPVWHKDDPNTWLHTKKVAKNAWAIPVPEGYTKQDQMVAALGHDFGKILSGDGHAEVSYNLIKQIFPDATEKQLNAIRKHMNPIQEIVKEVKKLGNKDQQYFADQLTTATKFADIGVIPGADLTQLGLTPEELEIVKQTKWFKEGGNLIPKAAGGKKLLENIFHKIFPGKTLKELTPEEWDIAYDYILKKYNNNPSNILQKIRDYHFYTAAPDTIVKEVSGKPIQVFHGGTSPNIREFSLDTPNNASLTDILDKRIYFSDKKGIARQYAVDPEYKLALTIDHLADAVGLDKEGLEIIASHLEMPIEDVKKIVEDYKIGLDFVRRKTNEEDFIYPAYLNIRKHADVDLDGDIITRLSKEQRAKINVEPGAIIRNVDESVSNQYGIRMAPSTDYLVQYPQQIKRSAAITYDTNGNIIPISKRDNFHNPDINFKEGGTINKFQDGGTLSRWSIEQELPIFRHLKNLQLAQNIDQDLNEFFAKGEIQYGQLSKDARRDLQRKYNLDQKQIKETLDDLYNAGLGKALIADLITANINLASFKSGGVIQKCSIGSAIKKFAGEGLAGIEKNIIKETGENVALQATGNTKVIGKATTEHLRKVAKATNDQRIKVLADFAEQCRDKGIKLPEEFNQFVDSIFKTPVATKTDKKIIRVGKEVTADPEIITHNGVSIKRPTFDKIKYKTKTIHTGEFKDKLEFKRTIPKTQQELQELSPKIDEAINSLRSMMEGDSFKLTPTMMDEIYSKSKGRVQNFKDNKEQTGALRKLFGEIEYPTLVKRQLDSSYIYPQAPSEELVRFYNANAENIEWFKKIRNLAQHYVNDTAGKVQVTPLKITPRKQQVAVYHREGDYVSFLPKQIMTKQDAPYIKAYRLTIDGKPIKGTPTFNFEEHHSTPLSLMQAKAYLTNPNPKNAMEHVLTYQNQRKVNGSKDAHYNKFLVLNKAEHTGVNGIHYNDKWSLQDLQRIKALARSGRFKTMDDLLYYYDRLKAQQLSYLPKAKSGTKLIPKNYFRKDTTI